MKKRFTEIEYRLCIKRYNEKMRSKKEIKKRHRKSKAKNRQTELDLATLSKKAAREFNQNIDRYLESGDVQFDKETETIHLPKIMNFSTNFKETAQVIVLIRKFVDNYMLTRRYRHAYRLRVVDFDGLEKISTSAGLVLAATISGWNKKIKGSMKANHESWKDSIRVQLVQLGFFELFGLVPPDVVEADSAIKFIKYIEGISAADDKKIFELKKGLQNILDVNLEKEKWPYLVAGLTEAMTNSLQHAYPRKDETDKPWYMTGGFDANSRTLKVAFYDEGIGIPKSLPKKHGMEKVRNLISKFSTGYGDSHLIKAAVEMGRTSTGKGGRGKGLADMSDFIDQRKSGYLSIMSQKGLYKYEKIDKNSTKQSGRIKSLDYPIPGTLIIWSVNLETEHAHQ